LPSAYGPVARRRRSFRDFVLSLPETLTLYAVTGPNDCLLHVVRDMHELRGFILDRLMQRPEFAEAQTSTIYRLMQRPEFAEAQTSTIYPRTTKQVSEPLSSALVGRARKQNERP
jgi:hypothetical protein